jgi:polyhydroxybutyrate depolymerase
MRSGLLCSLALLAAHCGGSGGSPQEPADTSVPETGDSSDGTGGGNPEGGADDASSEDVATDSAAGDEFEASSDGSGSADAASDTGDAADGSTLYSGPCGVRTGMRLLTSRSVSVSGLDRTYLAYLPQSLDPLKPVPFVFVFHGALMNGQMMVDITQYTSLADSEGFAIAFPDGQDPNIPWNVARSTQTVCGTGNSVNNPNPVDFDFVDAIKAEVSRDQCLDAAHLFATGFSMGGYFSHHIACERSDFRAVAPHSGGTLANLSSCPTGHVPIIIFHGTGDGLIADGCDDPNATAVSGFPPSATLWAQKNGCQNTYTTVPETSDAGGSGQCYVYNGCPSGGQVELCTFNGMPHAWAGGLTGDAGTLLGAPTYPSATRLQWDFFKKYAW